MRKDLDERLKMAVNRTDSMKKAAGDVISILMMADERIIEGDKTYNELLSLAANSEKTDKYSIEEIGDVLHRLKEKIIAL